MNEVLTILRVHVYMIIITDFNINKVKTEFASTSDEI